MATASARRSLFAAEMRFFAIAAIVMAFINVAAFSFFAAMGISTFHAPVSVHVHAILFMGWILLFVSQACLAATGSRALHRKLGWLAVGWAAAMVIVGTLSTIWSAQKAAVPFFFLPAQFLLMSPLSVLLFAALLIAGVVKRHDRVSNCRHRARQASIPPRTPGLVGGPMCPSPLAIDDRNAGPQRGCRSPL